MTTDDLRIVFIGTAPLAAASLRALLTTPGFRVVGVVTPPDKPRDRDLKIQFSPVKSAALEAGLTVLQPAKVRELSSIDQLRALAPDLIVVAAYGQILPQALLDIPRFGCLNVHASLLPKYRGAAPIQWAILDGESETGVTLMKMDAGLDTGPMLTRVVTAIGPDDTAGTLHDRLAELGGKLLASTIPPYVSGQLTPEPQPTAGASYARKIVKDDGWIDWSASAQKIERQVRGLSPWPTAFTHLELEGGPVLIKLWKTEVDPLRQGPFGTVLEAPAGELIVGCGEQALRVLELQREGRRRVMTGDFLAGCRVPPGTRLSPPSRVGVQRVS